MIHPTGALPTHPIALLCHPASPWTPAFSLAVTLAAAGSEQGPGVLLQYRLLGELSELRLPAAMASGAADGLWQHTCFEAFVSLPGEAAYREFNCSPSGQWAAYRFAAERQRDVAAEVAEPASGIQIECACEPSALSLQAWLPLRLMPVAEPSRPWHWGLSAVLEHTDGRLSYWAHRHPCAQPDFHHPEGRRLTPALPTPVR